MAEIGHWPGQNQPLVIGELCCHRSSTGLWLGVMMATISGMLAWIQAWPWPVISGVFGAAAFSVVTYAQIVRPRLRRRKMRRPFKVYFVIPSRNRFEMNYVVQDDKDHLVKEIVVPSNSEISIELLLVPKLSFVQQEIYFGCETVRVDEGKPCPFEYFSSFVRKGVRGSGKPDKEHPAHYIDEDGLYHMREHHLYVNDPRRIGFKLATKRSGVYPAQVFVVTDEVRGKADDLLIRVEDAPATKMRCTSHRKCAVAPSPKATSAPLQLPGTDGADPVG